MPSCLSSRKKFSTASKPGGASPPDSAGKPPESQGSLSKFVIGSVAVGAAFLAAYQTGYLDHYLKKEQHSVAQEAQINVTSGDSNNLQHSVEHLVSPSNESPSVERAEQKVDTQLPQLKNVTEDQGDKQIKVQDKSDIPEEGAVDAKENQLPEYPQSDAASGDPSKESLIQSKGIDDIKSTEADVDVGLEEGIQHASTSTQTSVGPDENEIEDIQPQQQTMEERREVLMSLPGFNIQVNH